MKKLILQPNILNGSTLWSIRRTGEDDDRYCGDVAGG